MKKLKILDVISIIMAIALLLCLIDMPYGYYNFIRYATTILAIIWAINLWGKLRTFSWISIAIAVLFNPIFKIVLGRVLWNIADVVVAILLISVVAYHFKIIDQSKNNRNDNHIIDDCVDLGDNTTATKSNHTTKRNIKSKTIVKILVSIIIIAVVSIGGYFYFKPDTPEVKADKILLHQKQQAQTLEDDSLYYWCEKIIRKHDIPKCGNSELDENNKKALTELAWEKIKSLAFDGNCYAQFELGLFYDGYNFETGEWCTSKNSEGEYYNPNNINLDKVAYWYLQAAKQGISAAQHNLGFCYFDGKGVKENKEEAIKWFRIAISNGDDYSERMMGDLYRDGCKIYIGHRWEKIPNNGYYDWENKIGYKKINEYKTLIPQNIDSAIYYWNKAAAKGNETATERLQKIYESK